MAAKDDFLIKLAERADQAWYEILDVHDVKASIVLVLLSFLGTLAVVVLQGHPGSWVTAFQSFGILFISASIIAALVTLWPQKPWGPKFDDVWRQYCESAEVRPEAVKSKWLVGATKRIEHNKKIANRKLAANKCAFWLLLVAIAFEILSIFGLAISHLRLVSH